MNADNIKIDIAYRDEHTIRGYAMRFESTPPAGEIESFRLEAARADNSLWPKGYRIYDTPGTAGAFSYLAGRETRNASELEDQIAYCVPESDVATFETFFCLRGRDECDETIKDTLAEEMREFIYGAWLPNNAERGDGPDFIDWRNDPDHGWDMLRYTIPIKIQGEANLKQVAGL